jgi:hypothetical protein
MSKYKRSGDHYLIKVNKMIEGKEIAHNGSFVFGIGEASNHNHTITVDKPADLIIKRDNNGDYYFELKTDGFLKHLVGDSGKVADHKTIPIKKGIYRQIHEREVDIFSQAVRRVID